MVTRVLCRMEGDKNKNPAVWRGSCARVARGCKVLEGDVVILETARCRRRGRRALLALAVAAGTAAGLLALLLTAAVAATATVAAAKHLQLAGDDVRRVALYAVLVGVLVRAQRAFDVDLSAFL